MKSCGRLYHSNFFHIQDQSNVNGFTEIKSFLTSHQRRTRPIQGDGNCFFRAISETLYGQQDKHEEIRSALVNFIMSNKDIFAKFIPSTVDCIDNHLQRMQRWGTWATHLEIFAAASFFQIPIYVATQRSKTMVYYWEIYNPQSCNSIQCHFLKELCLRHIELAHVQRCHYETVKMNNGSQPKHPPRLETPSYHVDLVD